MYLLLHSIVLFSVLIYSESYDPFGAKRDNSNSELDNIAPSSNLDTEARSYGESGSPVPSSLVQPDELKEVLFKASLSSRECKRGGGANNANSKRKCVQIKHDNDDEQDEDKDKNKNNLGDKEDEQDINIENIDDKEDEDKENVKKVTTTTEAVTTKRTTTTEHPTNATQNTQEECPSDMYLVEGKCYILSQQSFMKQGDASMFCMSTKRGGVSGKLFLPMTYQECNDAVQLAKNERRSSAQGRRIFLWTDWVKNVARKQVISASRPGWDETMPDWLWAKTQEPKYPLMGSKSISRGKYKEACVATSGVGVGDVDCNNWARNDRKYALCEFPNVN